MTYLAAVRLADSASIDAFARLRVSNPLTLFDSKQTRNSGPLFWDEELESGSGISSAHDSDRASTTITSTVSTAGVFTRQTFQRFNYQPGKSQLVMMTGVLDKSGGGTGVQRRVGYFDDDNGLFFEDDAGSLRVVRRSNVTGSPVDTAVASTSWNLDTMDGTGPSGITIDTSKTQIFLIDFEWLGVGRVRFGIVIDGIPIYVHEFNNANSLDAVYMSTPNLPCRYQIVTTASSPASSIECICATVITEGGVENNGSFTWASSGTTQQAVSGSTFVPICGVRLKSTDLQLRTDMLRISIMETAGSFDGEWIVLWNPTFSSTPTWGSAGTDSGLEVTTTSSLSGLTLSGGHPVAGGFITAATGNSTASEGVDLSSPLRLGSAIDGTRDHVVLAARSISGSGSFSGGIQMQEDL